MPAALFRTLGATAFDVAEHQPYQGFRSQAETGDTGIVHAFCVQHVQG